MMAPYAWVIVAIGTLHYCNSGPLMRIVYPPWPLSWFMSPHFVPEDPTAPAYGAEWRVTVNRHEDLIEHFDTRDACVIFKDRDSLTYGYVECKAVEPPT